MQNKHMLMIPGPTPVPEAVLLAMAKHPIGHRSGDFSKVIGELTENLKWLHQTENDVLMLTVSGTGAMEAGIINFLSPGDRVLAADNGKFGERWVKLSKAFGLNVDVISSEWGKPLNPEDFKEKLVSDKDKTIKAVIMTHSETSTGVINDLKSISKIVKDHGEALLIVDAVTSLGATSVPVDDWGIDVVASGSQKGYMIPPGMGFVSVSKKAWKAYETAKIPRFYLDLGKYKKETDKNSSPYTTPVNLMYGLQVALRMMKEEGLESIFERHQRLTQGTRAAMTAMGLPLFGADHCASPAVTAVAPTMDAEKVRSALRKKFDIAVAGGQDHLKGQIFRIGHLGFVCERDMLTVIASLEATLLDLGYEGLNPGAGIAAAAKVFS
ncbi:alanine--glyoxylate aminotransferase family protein [Chroococcus sp. FPU101]|uniref:pyridoxal-phosphate-dependent aminotransferase family protein n=1 Tax=Chroococcus sp. FPU101 TaxID=1974212 RepID=UPI001A8FB01F|nr:alanine--glyoxylate aminotransferase family protein [Chroococcus sp. FPU101]GFE71090.1 soluble hydrogenase 42 kDa subunit [Chroococcus sp. FPU101]